MTTSQRESAKASEALKAVGDLGGKLSEEFTKKLRPVEAPGEVAEEAWIPFGCVLCGMGPDPARAHVVNGVLVKIEGDPKFREQWPCPSLVCATSYGAAQKLYNPYRIKAPMKRTNPKKGWDEDPKFVEISWDEALDILAEKLRAIREKGVEDEQGLPRVVAASGVPVTILGYEGHGWRPFWAAWGAVDNDMRGGAGVKCAQSEHVFGELWSRAFISTPDFRLCNYVIFFGTNVGVTSRKSGTGTPIAYADARARGMKQIYVCPAINQTAATADEWIPIKVKTDAAFILAMIHVILHEMDWHKVCDIPFLKRMTNSPYLIGPHGYYVRDPDTKKPLVWDPSVPGARAVDEAEDFALEGTYDIKGIENGPDGEVYPAEKGTPSFQLLIEHVKDYAPEWASAITDVPAETIRRIAREFVEHALVGATIEIEGVELPYRPVATGLGRGINNGWGGYQLFWAQTVLQTLVGALEVPGGFLGTDIYVYMFVPFGRDADGFLLSSIHPTDKVNWAWPPKSRAGIETLTPLSGPGPVRFGAEHLSWKSFTEPLEKWPVSVPDAYICFHSNPVITQYDSNLVRKALEKIPFTAIFAFTMNETNWYADLLLPENPDFESFEFNNRWVTSGHKAHTHNYAGCFIRQPAIKPLFNTRDLTDIFTELADRLGMLSVYNSLLPLVFGMQSPFELSPEKKYSVEEIMDRLCKSATGEEHGLEWFKENGGILWPISELDSYLHVKMVEQGIRYELPYQGRLKVVGEELKQRLHEVGIEWWDHQAETYAQPLPKWEDFSAIYRDVYQVGPEYDMWPIYHRATINPGCDNLDVPWNAEIGKDVLDFPGVLINPQTARRKGIRDGDRVCLESAFGKTYGEAFLSETVRPEVLAMLGFGHYMTPVAKELGLPNQSELDRIDIRLIGPDGSSSDHTIVKIYKV
jgi:phenylacetyl-CoA:acceptor oxidoreductase